MPNLNILGVINLTPNSFSDGGKFLDKKLLKSSLQEFLSFKNLIIDIGFESTAPMNQAISEEEERGRFYIFMEFLNNHQDIKFEKISFDTYRPANFLLFYTEIKKVYPEINVIFNDVSGVLDDELADVLVKCPEVKYIFTSTRIPDRSKVSGHMKFLAKKEASIVEETFLRFKEAYNWFKDKKLVDRLMFDPGFGFSKSYEENWELINQFNLLEEKLVSVNIKIPWVIGLSRKSFLKKKCEGADDLLEAIEVLHQNILESIYKNTQLETYFRVHNPQIVSKFYSI